MRRIIIISVVALLIVITVVVAVNYFNVPEYIRNRNMEEELSSELSAQWIDKRIGTAIEEGKSCIMEDDGIDIPYSDELLHTLENHFNTDIEFIGAGIYWGLITPNTAVEILLNSKGNVGQVQICASEMVDETELDSAIAVYVQFIMPSIEQSEVKKVLQEVVPEIRDLKTGEPYLYYGHSVGFSCEVVDNMLFICIP